ATQLFLGGRRCSHDVFKAVKVEHVIGVHLDVDVDVGLRHHELLAHDRALHDLRGGHQHGESGWMRPLAGHDGRAAHVDGDGDIGLSVKDVKWQRIGEAAVHEHAS